MNKEILFIGADGFVGTKTVEAMRSGNLTVLSPSQNELDITNRELVRTAISSTSAKAIILAAAFTDVDGAEQNPELAYKVNMKGVEYIAKAALEHNKFLVFISTDFVFPGTTQNPGPYNENEPVADPSSDEIGQYAKTKILAEKFLAEMDVKHAVVRIAFPFGNPESEKDLLHKILIALEKGYGLFTDQQYTPTYIPDLADALVKICTQELEGTFHICCQPPTSPYQLGKLINKQQGLNIKVKPGSFVDYMAKAKKKAPRTQLGGFDDKLTNNKLSRKSPQLDIAVKEALKQL